MNEIPDYMSAAKKAAAKSLSSRPHDIMIRGGADLEDEVFFRAMDRDDATMIAQHLNMLGCRVGHVKGGVKALGIDSIRALVENGFDTGANKDLFPDIESGISPSRFS